MAKLIFYFTVLLFSASLSNAEIITSVADDKEKLVTVANIYYTATVNNRSVAELGDVLNQISIKNPTVKQVNLIINSGGGEVFAGMMATAIVRSSTVPVTVINGGMTASAATFFYCATKNRQAVPGAAFLLHAASTQMAGGKPDELRRELAELDHIHKFIKGLYQECTSLSDAEIDNIFQAEYFAKYIDDEQASAIKLSNQTVQTIPRPDLSFFIVDKEDDE